MNNTDLLPFRIGHGFDVHAFCEGNSVMLGGVKIPCEYGLRAHSDGDVVLHAVCDALLGAIAKGDIGQHFPDNDPKFNNIDSSLLLQDVCQLVTEAGYKVGNIDVTVVAQHPKLSTYIESICQRISEIISVSVCQINVKATTTEKLGYVGREEGIAVHAVALLLITSV